MIKLTDVTKIYKTGDISTTALDKVSIEIKDGEMVAVMGVSGSGKTTLINIIGGMDRLTEGSYMYDDIKVDKLGSFALDKFRKNHVSFVFQHFALIGEYTVLENVTMPLRIKNIGRKERSERALAALKAVGMDEYKSKKAKNISGGQQQRVAIARAIAQGNSVILADEPTGALDSNNSSNTIELLRKINETGKTVIVITHDISVGEKCDRIIRLADGKVVG